MRKPTAACLAIIAVTAAMQHDAMAVDGVRLLRQPRTFPIVISNPGSYRLGGNLTVSTPDTTAIDAEASDVTIDLNDFTIAGPVTCTGTPPSLGTCNPLWQPPTPAQASRLTMAPCWSATA